MLLNTLLAEVLSESITFWIPGAPNRDELPEINMTNSMAASVLEMLGLEQEPAGTIELDRIPNVIRNIMRVLNSSKRIKANTIDPYKDRNILSGGIDSDRIIRNLQGVLAVLRAAQENEQSVTWG